MYSMYIHIYAYLTIGAQVLHLLKSKFASAKSQICKLLSSYILFSLLYYSVNLIR